MSPIEALQRRDARLALLLRAAALAAGSLAAFVAVFLAVESLPVLRAAGISAFFTDPTWNPAEGLYSLTPMLWGTLWTASGAVALAAPLGVAAALFGRFAAPPPLAAAQRRVLELLAGIPSVVYGFFGLVVLVPRIAEIRPPGTSLLAGILVLCVMVLPVMALTADAAFATVPRETLQGCAALGLTRWTTLSRVVLPSVRRPLATGLLLQAGRALGETMAVLMVCGNVARTPGSLFDPVRTLTANVALEMAYALGNHRSALFASGLLLLLIAALLVLAAERISNFKAKP